jgi:uncharacterized protein with von Willebrand factor type A (vWA) domain
MSRNRYSRWDGTQDPFGAELPIDELADQLAEDVLDGWGIDNSLRRLLEQGMDGRFDGLRQLRDRLDAMRRAQQERTGRPDPLADIKERLAEVESLEREALATDSSEDARFAELNLDTLPDNTASRIRELREHEWRSDEAREGFEEILDELRRQTLDASFRQISEGMQNISPADMERVKDMLADLNAMMEQRANGLGPSQEQFDEFMRRHGEFFPENPSTFDELLDTLARRSMAMSRYMASLTPEQREELASLMEDMMQDMDLAFQLNQLGSNLRSLAPQMPWDQAMEMGGEPVGLSEGLDQIDQASRLDELERALGQDYAGAALEDIDEEDLRRALGDDAVRDVRRLRQIEKMLEDSGVIMRTGGRLELTPRGVRKLGERALTQVFERLALGRPGSHEVASSGGNDEPTGQSRPWRHGDPFRLDLRRTIHNAVLRNGPTDGRVDLHPDDFEIQEAEHRTSTATVLLLDMSRSMPLRGHWLPAKRMALALHTLITTGYPEDSIDIVGFSDYARRMNPGDLAEVDWEPVYGTNMEHAFSLAGRILSKHRDATKHVLLVTDGEPTAHLEGEYVYFNWPPVRETLEKTYKEAMRLAKSGVTMNIFMLENTPGLVDFIDRLAKIVEGRVFMSHGEELGDLVVSDYVRRR